MAFAYLKEIIEAAEKENKPFWQIVIEDDMRERNVSYEQSFETMRGMYQAMKEADAAYDPKLRSASGMVGGDGEKLEEFHKKKNRLIGDFLTEIMEKAVKMGESNACMKRIVAAPTAGSCGVIPAVLLTYEKQKNVSEDKLVEALFVAAGRKVLNCKPCGLPRPLTLGEVASRSDDGEGKPGRGKAAPLFSTAQNKAKASPLPARLHPGSTGAYGRKRPPLLAYSISPANMVYLPRNRNFAGAHL